MSTSLVGCESLEADSLQYLTIKRGKCSDQANIKNIKNKENRQVLYAYNL